LPPNFPKISSIKSVSLTNQAITSIIFFHLMFKKTFGALLIHTIPSLTLPVALEGQKISPRKFWGERAAISKKYCMHDLSIQKIYKCRIVLICGYFFCSRWSKEPEFLGQSTCFPMMGISFLKKLLDVY